MITIAKIFGVEWDNAAQKYCTSNPKLKDLATMLNAYGPRLERLSDADSRGQFMDYLQATDDDDEVAWAVLAALCLRLAKVLN